MSEVFSQCTKCYRNLTPEEIEKNKEKELLYYPICDHCLEEAKEKIKKILNS